MILASMLIIISGLGLAVLLSIYDGKTFVEVFKNPIAAFGLIGFPACLGIFIFYLGRLVAGENNFIFPRLEKPD